MFYLLFLLFVTQQALATLYIPDQFYYPPYIQTEPRLSKPWLSTIEFAITKGRARHALNNNSNKVSFFDFIHRTTGHNTGNTFHFLQLTGQYTQNFDHGFFCTITVPFRHLFFSHDSPQNDTLGTRKNTGFSDSTFLIGHTTSIVDTECLDFLDIEIQTGLLAPSENQNRSQSSLALPRGLSHWGILFTGNIALGFVEWFTGGLTTNVLLFAPHTDRHQKYHKNPQCSSSIYAKADHVSRGLSIMGSYSFTIQGRTAVNSRNYTLRQELFSWYAHALHVAFEYDFTRPYHTLGPRLSVMYDKTISGKNVFLTSLLSGSLAIDISWTF